MDCYRTNNDSTTQVLIRAQPPEQQIKTFDKTEEYSRDEYRSDYMKHVE
jgi:hypothetical protein